MRAPELSEPVSSSPSAAERFIELRASALRPGMSPVRIRVRTFGAGTPVLLLHGGWGCDAYPFDRQIAALVGERQIVAPDRSGYGGSGRLLTQEIDFHRRAAAETFAVIEAMGLERPVLWGHSDGAVIALLMALDAPARVGGAILEATHLFRRKPASQAFFEQMRDNPDGLGDRITTALAREHGDGWRRLIAINGDAWLRLAEQGGDLYDSRLSMLHVPALVIHGGRDPRTEPGELDALHAALGRTKVLPYESYDSEVGPLVAQECDPAALSVVGQDFSPAYKRRVRFAAFPDAGHSPHSERATAGDVTRAAVRFLSEIAPVPERSRR